MTQSSVLSPQSCKKPTRWLITGGCGFIGINLVKNLIDEGGHYVRIVDNLSVGTREDLKRICNFTELSPPSSVLSPDPNSSPSTQIELIVVDIMDRGLSLTVSKDIDVIVHLAANTGVASSVEDPRSDCVVNVVGTLNYLEAARGNGISRFIFASSGAPIGECEPPVHEELAPHPVSPYGASKLAGEAYCSAYFRTFGVDTISLRFGNVYGPGSNHKNSVIAKFIRQALNGEILEIYGDGKQTRDFIFIDDLIRALRQAAFKPNIGGEIFQIATFQETTVDEIAQSVKKMVGKERGNEVNIMYRDPRPGDVKRNCSDISKAKNMLGYEPHFSLNEGLKKTLSYFINLPEQRRGE